MHLVRQMKNYTIPKYKRLCWKIIKSESKVGITKNSLFACLIYGDHIEKLEKKCLTFDQTIDIRIENRNVECVNA